MAQEKHAQWREEWSRFKEESPFIFQEWIHPNTLEGFRGRRVLDAGCGHGHHARIVAPYAAKVVGVDLNTAEIARHETRDIPNVEILEGDIAEIGFPEPFDIVYCIGVIHHTDDPDKTFENLKRLTLKGGRLIIWVYSREGNWLNRVVLESLKRAFLLRLGAGPLLVLAYLLTFLLYPIVWTLYLLPGARRLPYSEYFGNFRILPFRKNIQNVFDKLIAPQTFFLERGRVEKWFSQDFEDVHVSAYMGVSWRASGKRR